LDRGLHFHSMGKCERMNQIENGKQHRAGRGAFNKRLVQCGTALFLFMIFLAANPARCQTAAGGWKAEVRRFAEAQQWEEAMAAIEAEQERRPGDIEVREWRARVLTWSGNLPQAEKEWNEIVRIAPKDPDNWLGLASVYQRQGRIEEARRAIDSAVEIDPARADLHLARGRILRASNSPKEAKTEFERALQLDPGSGEARASLESLQEETKHTLRFGEDNDAFNFAGTNRDEWTELSSNWARHFATDFGGSFFQRAGTGAGKFTGSVTGRSSRWGAFTAGGASAAGQDNGVIPKSEAFFEAVHGFRVSETAWVRAIETAYGQHWYWYRDARILALNQTTTVYFPRDWRWTLRVTEARSHFSNTAKEWKPSGSAKLNFPLVRRNSRALSGGIFFAAGTENFAQVDQIGSFASQTYGGELKFQFSRRQDVTAYSFYQERTEGRTQTSFGFSYGIRF